MTSAQIELVLLVIRVVSSILLLSILLGLGLLAYRQLQATNRLLGKRVRQFGWLTMLQEDSDRVGFQAGHSSSVRFPLMPVTTIGRARENSVRLEDDFASNRHAVVTLRGQHWWLEDLDSRNGTLLNDVPIDKEVVISAGDVIAIGNNRLLIELQDM